MALEKISFGNIVIFALALAEVTSWTIDLPEVRKYIFEKNEEEEREEKYGNYKYNNAENPLYYSNIAGNSKHNTNHYGDVYENAPYAREFGYESYMEKKVNGIVYNGSVYLEGLRRALEDYSRLLEDCARMNSSTRSAQNRTAWLLPVESPASSNSSSNSSRCREATRTSEHVRRLSELATWATRELQDIAYARKYKKDDEHSLSMQENELILKLAWFLDRLAHYTGYEPEPGDFLEKKDEVPLGPTSSTTTAGPASLVSPSPEVKRLMMECLQQNSSEAAVDRCRYPEPLPPLVQGMMEMNSNNTGIPTMPAPSSSNLNQQVVPITRSDLVSEQSMELLIASDFKTPSSSQLGFTARMTEDLPSLTAVKKKRKRSVLSMAGPEVRLKVPEMRRQGLNSSLKFRRTAKVGISAKSLIENDPTIKFNAKHKVLVGAKTKSVNGKSFKTHEVKNQLKHRISKRTIDNKKSTHLKLPENAFQDLSKYIKHKPGVRFVKDEALTEKIIAALKKMDGKQSASTKMLRQKRSIKYEKDVDLPRESGDPQKDISYYTKNKPGRNYNNDLLQALQVRAGLQQVFNTGNIEVVRRFGANYNPLIPAPFYVGIMKSQADFRK